MIYLLYLYLTDINGNVGVIPSDPYVFTYEQCHETGKSSREMILKKYPTLKVNYKCKEYARNS